MHWERSLLLLKGEEQKSASKNYGKPEKGTQMLFDLGFSKSLGNSYHPRDQMSRDVLRHPSPLQLPYSHLQLIFQGDLGPFNPGLPVEVPVWLAINLKQRQKCRLIPPAWMDVGKDSSFRGYKGNTERPLAFTISGELN